MSQADLKAFKFPFSRYIYDFFFDKTCVDECYISSILEYSGVVYIQHFYLKIILNYKKELHVLVHNAFFGMGAVLQSITICLLQPFN